jgi:Meiotically up-regulated gene 113/Helix-turn-helix domain
MSRLLAKDKREQIKTLRSDGLSYTQIASVVGCHPSTVARLVNPSIRQSARNATIKRNATLRESRNTDARHAYTQTKHDSCVYVASSARQQMCKIGLTTNAKRRLNELRTGCPDIEILLLLPGDRTLELDIHDKLEQYRVVREWFEIDDPTALCQQLREEYEQ